MNKEDLGKKFYRDGKTYEAIAYTDEPTMELKNVVNGERISVVVGSDYSKEFQSLEDTPKEDKKIEKIEHFKTRAGTIAKLRFDLETINNRFENKINEIIDKINGDSDE